MVFSLRDCWGLETMGNAKTVSEHIHCLGEFNDLTLDERSSSLEERQKNFSKLLLVLVDANYDTIDNDFFFAHYSELRKLNCGKVLSKLFFHICSATKVSCWWFNTRKRKTNSKLSSSLRPLPYSTIPVKLHEKRKNVQILFLTSRTSRRLSITCVCTCWSVKNEWRSSRKEKSSSCFWTGRRAALRSHTREMRRNWWAWEDPRRRWKKNEKRWRK